MLPPIECQKVKQEGMKTIDRILLIICDTAWMKSHLVRSWRMTGAEVTVEYFGTTMGRGWDSQGTRLHRERNARWRNIASRIDAERGLDMVFMVALDDVLEQKTLIHFRKLGAKLVLYQVDMLTQWYRVIRSVKFMDLVCYASKDHLEYFEKRAVPLFNFGFAAAPPTPKEISNTAINYDGVLFTGSPWAYRQRILLNIAAAGIPLRIYGHNWTRKGPWPTTLGSWRKTAHDLWWYLLPRIEEERSKFAVRFLARLRSARKQEVQSDSFPAGVIRGEYAVDQFVPLVRGAAVNLGFTQMSLDPAQEYPRQIRLRDLEIPMAGGFYLAQNCPGLSCYFEIDREIAVWDSAKDIIDRCHYYLAHPEERKQIAEAGRLRALRSHTWLQRLSAMAARLGLRLPIDTR
jgi:spore maturation protein CgeB